MAGGIYKYTVDNTHIRRVDDDDGYIDGWWVGMGWTAGWDGMGWDVDRRKEQIRCFFILWVDIN